VITKFPAESSKRRVLHQITNNVTCKAIIFILLVSSFCQLFSQELPKISFSDIPRIENDLNQIIGTDKSRNYHNLIALNSTAEYIKSELAKSCDSVYFQSYTVNKIEYKNVIGVKKSTNPKRLIVGAHYDVCDNQDGADDNASGVAGLLETARLLSKEKLKYTIEYVAYTLEEPPYFKSDKMGSYMHAKNLSDNEIDVKGMICLEMIGYYSDIPKSQTYPIGILSWFYGNKGNYIMVIRKWGAGDFAKNATKLMKKQHLIKTKSFSCTSKLPTLDFSDHLNYWKFGFDAILITNTAFYRNKNYHEETDKIKTLDLKKVSAVIDELYITIKNID
jgi:Zn-dependent M28 family amino/carboxypeptidase